MTTPSLRCEPARPGDADALTRLVRASLPAAIRPLTIYGCKGIGGFAAAEIAVASLESAGAYVVARQAGRLVGAAVWRRGAGQLMLSYIAIAPSLRGQGLGSRLLADSLRLLAPAPDDRIILDVFDDNLRAVDWYRRLGFATETHAGWWTRDLPDARGSADPAARVVIGGLATAAAVFPRFGFTELTLLSAGQRHQVGCLGRNWYRVLSPELLGDAAALAALRRHDPRRRLLAIMPLEKPPALLTGLEPVTTAQRMSIMAHALTIPA